MSTLGGSSSPSSLLLSSSPSPSCVCVCICVPASFSFPPQGKKEQIFSHAIYTLALHTPTNKRNASKKPVKPHTAAVQAKALVQCSSDKVKSSAPSSTTVPVVCVCVCGCGPFQHADARIHEHIHTHTHYLAAAWPLTACSQSLLSVVASP